MKFKVNVMSTFTTSGYVRIKAKNATDARRKVDDLIRDGQLEKVVEWEQDCDGVETTDVELDDEDA